MAVKKKKVHVLVADGARMTLCGRSRDEAYELVVMARMVERFKAGHTCRLCLDGAKKLGGI